MEKVLSKPENDKPLIPMEPTTQGMSSQELIPISHKDFNKFIKGRGFVGRNNYRLRELKAMFGFKPLTKGNQVSVTIDDGKEFRTFKSMLKASLAVGMPYTTLRQANRKSKRSCINPVTVKSGREIYVIKFGDGLN